MSIASERARRTKQPTFAELYSPKLVTVLREGYGLADFRANHADQMAEHWDNLVGDDDIVLVPGDLSWAMKLEEAALDLAWIGARKGAKKA